MKMNANEVVESYVTDVALRLPRKQRNDVAFELRALINEGLQDKSDETGRAIDAAMATEFLNAFGHPETVAARYRPALNIVDPADGQKFWRATSTGLAIIWGLGLLELFQTAPEVGFLNALAKWWMGTVIGSLWWPGVLVAGFGISAWAGRRWPQKTEWKPKANDRIRGGRLGIVMGLIGVMFGLYILAKPTWVLDVVWGGHAAPVAYQALTYTDSFLQLQGPILFVLMLLYIPFFIAVLVKGRHTPMLRRIETASSLLTCAVMLWAIMDGPIFMTATSDGVTKSLLLLIVIFSLSVMAIMRFRTVKPTPDQQVQIGR
ncbi:MAG TPA: hypothetical protein PK135_13230 [Arenimonas sp.]|nr:hypothetical protein [Arenimonas sp.]